MNTKFSQLEKIISGKGKLAVALSGGLDSSVLLAFAAAVLGPDRCLAITARTPYMMSEELADAEKLCGTLGVRMILVEMGIPVALLSNPTQRCYLCKKEIFCKFAHTARDQDFDELADGTNSDDKDHERPGHKALKELGILSPLRDAGLSKDDIRELGRKLGLDESIVTKPPYACLMTRFEHGVSISRNDLAKIDAAEQFLRQKGMRACRVRIHHNDARIEIPREEWHVLMEPGMSAEVTEYFKSLNFRFVSLDLEGYRQGNMNRRY